MDVADLLRGKEQPRLLMLYIKPSIITFSQVDLEGATVCLTMYAPIIFDFTQFVILLDAQ